MIVGCKFELSKAVDYSIYFVYASSVNIYTTREAGFSHVLIVVILVVVAVVGFVGWRVATSSGTDTTKTSTVATETTTSNTTKSGTTNTTNTKTTPSTPKAKDPDSASTIDSPQKVATKTGGQYFYYGAPAGQNNASPKKIFITLHGTEGSAEKDYEIWKPFVKETQFALATLNWWDGSGDQTSDYTAPDVIKAQIHDFLSSQGYASGDVVVLEGFSRGSANSYSVAALDRSDSSPMIDLVVSSSGGAESTYYDSTTKSIPAKTQSKIFGGVYWILACGKKDPNPTRDGCEAMEATKTFVSNKGATVLGTLSDPNGGHGALTTSSLGLAKQMFELIEQKL